MAGEAADEVPDIRVPSPAETLIAWLGPPRRYQLTRTLIIRLLGFIYVFAFLGLILQGPGLLGSHGLTPVATYVERAHAAGYSAWDLPSIFMWDASDGALAAWAYVGLVLAACAALGYANMISLVILWVIYGSFERVGQLWFSFGWEIQILETTLIAAVLAHPWDPRPLAAKPPPVTGIVLARWLVFRIMLGAGLIKLRGDACWHDLTCLDWHFETQPIPNPLSPWFHHLPHAVHAGGVVFNHIVEVVAPWFVFGPRRLRLVAGCMMAAFQLVLIASGNLAFLNWLTLVPILACFDDDAWLAIVPRRARAWLRARMPAGATHQPPSPVAKRDLFSWLRLGLVPSAIVSLVRFARRAFRRGARPEPHRVIAGAFAVLVAYKSLPVIANLASHHQQMNRSYDRLELVNTYGAFGVVDEVRHELVIEGTLDADPDHATWQPYELPCKPGALDRRPCVLGPYHLRLDWLIWFAAMEDEPRDAWVLRVVYKLLDGDRAIRTLLATDPFGGRPPAWVRIRRFVYHFAPAGDPAWWTRDGEQLWLAPVSLHSEDFLAALRQTGWVSPSLHD